MVNTFSCLNFVVELFCLNFCPKHIIGKLWQLYSGTVQTFVTWPQLLTNFGLIAISWPNNQTCLEELQLRQVFQWWSVIFSYLPSSYNFSFFVVHYTIRCQMKYALHFVVIGQLIHREPSRHPSKWLYYEQTLEISPVACQCHQSKQKTSVRVR